jgi:hypothetical protein
MNDVIIDPDDLRFDGRSFQEIDVVRLHASCLVQMTRFVAQPTLMQVAVVAAMLEALSRHVDSCRPDCGCDVYAQARATWLQLLARMRTNEAAQAGTPVRH